MRRRRSGWWYRWRWQWCVIGGLLFSAAQWGDVFAQAVRIYSSEFLYLGAGAREMGMGNAGILSSSGGFVGYWNPGLLSRVGKTPLIVSLMYSSYFGNLLQYVAGGVVRPLDGEKPERGAVGITLLRSGVDDIPYTITMLRPDGTVDFNAVSSFSAVDYALLFSFGRHLTIFRKKNEDRGMSGGAGISIKIIHRLAGTFARAWGFGLDAGGWVKPWKGVRVGVVIRDVFSTVTFWRYTFTDYEKQVLQLTGNAVPDRSVEVTVPRLILAIAYSRQVTAWMDLRMEVNLTLTSDGRRNTLLPTRFVSGEPTGGAEVILWDRLALRGGIWMVQKVPVLHEPGRWVWGVNPSLGAGILLRRAEIHYALLGAGITHRILPSHVISLQIRLMKERDL